MDIGLELAKQIPEPIRSYEGYNQNLTRLYTLDQ